MLLYPWCIHCWIPVGFCSLFSKKQGETDMKILVIHTIYTTRGGEESVVENEVEDLKRAGHEVKTLFFSNGGNALVQALKIAALPFNPLSYFQTRRILREFRPDVVHIHNWNFAASPSVIRAARAEGIAVVLTIHNFRLLCPSATLFHDGNLFMDSVNGHFPWAAIKKAVYRNSRIITFWLAFSVYVHKKLGTWKGVNKYIVLNEFTRSLFARSDLHLGESQ
ncbi:MAG: hypothetical protein EOO01_40620, partial [Chitinophagaceae bacterium]